MSSPAEVPGGEVILYEAPDGAVRVDVRLVHETVWLTQAQMVELFGRDQSVVSRHLRNVFADGELPAEGNMQKMHIASADKPTTLYSLDVKRIGSFLFMLYLQQEGMTHSLNPQALTALALLIAESAPSTKDLMIRLIINLLTERGG